MIPIAHSSTFRGQLFGESYIQSVQPLHNALGQQHTPELHDKFHKLCFMSDSAFRTRLCYSFTTALLSR